MSELKKEWFKVCKNQCCKCNDKPKFVVGKDVKEGELGFFLEESILSGAIAIKATKGFSPLRINSDGTFTRYSCGRISSSVQLDDSGRIKVSE